MLVTLEITHVSMESMTLMLMYIYMYVGTLPKFNVLSDINIKYVRVEMVNK